MAEKRLGDDGDGEQPAPAHEDPLFLGKREWIAALAFPWALALTLMLSYGGEHVPPYVPLGRVLCSAVILALVVCAAMCTGDARPSDGTRRAPRLAGVVALLGTPVVAGVMVSTDLGFAVVPAGLALLYCVAFALIQMSCALGKAYSPVAAAWYAVPPFVYYVLLEMYGVKTPALLYLSPASGVVVASGAGSFIAGCAYAAVVPVLVGAGLWVGRRRSGPDEAVAAGNDPPQFA